MDDLEKDPADTATDPAPAGDDAAPAAADDDADKTEATEPASE